MGGTQSAKAKKFRNLSSEQLGVIQSKVQGLCTTNGLTNSSFERLLECWGKYASSAFSHLSKHHNGADGGRISVDDFLKVIDLLEGIAGEQAQALMHLFGKEWKDAVVTIAGIFHCLSTDDISSLCKHFNSTLHAFDENVIANVITSNRLLGELLRTLPHKLLSRKTVLMPTLTGTSVVMTRLAQLVIRAHLPVEYRDRWQLLFSSHQHGSSFSQLAQRIDGQGPCIGIVQSSNDYVFGFYASHGFVSGPTFTGDTMSFLFSLQPTIGVYEATGFAQKYCYLNQAQETLPNGMGIGPGPDNNWSLFISEDYGKGIASANSIAFEKCDIAGEKNFTINVVEMWRVGPPPTEKRQGKSILDKDPQAEALLELAGKKMESAAFRDPVPLLDNGSDGEGN